jgi:hypothetical protein
MLPSIGRNRRFAAVAVYVLRFMCEKTRKTKNINPEDGHARGDFQERRDRRRHIAGA